MLMTMKVMTGNVEKSGIAWNGRTRGKCSRAREHPYRGEKLRNSATNSLRIEKATLREADLVFHSAGKTCGRFSGDVEIFAERFAESVLESKENTRRKSSTEQTTRFLSQTFYQMRRKRNSGYHLLYFRNNDI